MDAESGQSRGGSAAGPKDDRAAFRQDAGASSIIPEHKHARRERRHAFRAASGLRLARLRGRIAGALETERDFGHGFLWAAVAFAAGAAIWRVLPSDPGLAAVVLPTLCLLLAAPVAGRASRGLKEAAILAAMVFAGMTASEIEARRGLLTVLDGPVVTTIEGVVEAREVDTGEHWRYTIALTGTRDPEIRRMPERVRLLASSPHPPIAIGKTIEGRARLSPPSGPATPGAFDFAFNSYFIGLGAYGFFYDAPQRPGTQAASVSAYERGARDMRQLRETIAFRIRDVLPGDAGAVGAAMTVSDRRGISEATDEAFRITGLAHILSISGLHMALAAGIMYGGLRYALALLPGLAQSFAVRKWAALGAIATSTAYLFISGAVVSAQRAWIMVVIMLAAVLLDRQALTMRNVAIAAFVILAITPSAVTSPGFQMSFAATAALIAGYAAWQKHRAGREREPAPFRARSARSWLGVWLFGVVLSTVVAGAATGIFTAHHFYRMSGYGMVANIAVLPLISAIVMPGAVVALLLMPFGLDYLPLRIMGLGLEATLWIAHRVASLGGEVLTGLVPTAVTVLLTAALVIAVLTRTVLWAVALAPAGLALVLLAVAPPERPAVLISEDGRLVALSRPGALAANRARPPSFLFEQWRTATRSADHVPPVMTDGETAADAPTSEHRGTAARRALGTAMVGLRNAESPDAFVCHGETWCVGRLADGDHLVWLDDAAFIGAACDLAQIVVTPRPLAMPACRSGALLFTGRTLRRTGAVVLHARAGGGDGHGTGPVATAQAAPGDAPESGYRITTALDGIVRPWTVHRYYDWRSGDFDLP